VTFNVLSVVDEDSPTSTLVPEPGDDPNTVELEPADGADVKVLPATTLTVREVAKGRPPQRVVRLHDIEVTVFVTDQRVAVACSKYDKGGGWVPLGGVGAVGVALAANAVSKARAANRRKGKMLVGHVRHGWLVSVGFTERTGLLSHEVLRLGLVDPTATARGLILDITLSKHVSAKEVARDTTKRAAAFHLAHSSEMPEPQRQRITGLLEPPPLPAESRRFPSYFFHDFPPPLQAAYEAG
jgi:hypothetical protein